MRVPLGFEDTLHIRVEPELRRALRDAARRERVTPSEVVRRSLRAVLTRPSSHEAHGPSLSRAGAQ